MDGDRKYKQNGYQDSGRDHHERREDRRDDRPKPQGPKLPIDVTGPRLPRMVQAVSASRCYNCATTLGPGTDFRANCPKCNAALHCCKQCAYFEPSTRFQCKKPILARIAMKDQANECDQFRARVTVARDAVPGGGGIALPPLGSAGPSLSLPTVPEPRTSSEARAAFDSLFRK